MLSPRREHRLPAFQSARRTGCSKATASRLLRRHGLHRHAFQEAALAFFGRHGITAQRVRSDNGPGHHARV